MPELRRALIYCARAYWGLTVFFLALPFVFGERVGSTAFAATFFGAVTLAVLGLLVYGSARYAAGAAEGLLSRRVLWCIAAAAWAAFGTVALLAVWLVVEQLRLK